MKFPETMESAGVVSSKPRQRFRAKHVQTRSGSHRHQKAKKEGRPEAAFDLFAWGSAGIIAFSSEVGTGSREENASNKNLELRF